VGHLAGLADFRQDGLVDPTQPDVRLAVKRIAEQLVARRGRGTHARDTRRLSPASHRRERSGLSSSMDRSNPPHPAWAYFDAMASVMILIRRSTSKGFISASVTKPLLIALCTAGTRACAETMMTG
jgi:hypothetical protein